jgi:hypothetical protein
LTDVNELLEATPSLSCELKPLEAMQLVVHERAALTVLAEALGAGALVWRLSLTPSPLCLALDVR